MSPEYLEHCMEFTEGIHKSSSRKTVFEAEPDPPSQRWWTHRARVLVVLSLIVLLILSSVVGILLWRAAQKPTISSLLPWCTVSGAPPGSMLSLSGVSNKDIWGLSNGQIVHWNGVFWDTPSQIVLPPQSVLNSILEIAPNNVWAVGAYPPQNDPSFSQTLVLHWDGKRWQMVSSPNMPFPGRNTLTALSAVSSRDIWAVGSFSSNTAVGSPSDHSAPLVEHWDGQRWNLMPSLVFPSQFVQLTSIKAWSRTNVWVVGLVSDTTTGTFHPVIGRWNGQYWQAVSHSAQQMADGALFSINGSAPNDLWAVGKSQIAMLIEHWNGAVWNTVPTPTIPPGPAPHSEQQNALLSVAALSPSDAWAVGSLPYNRSIIEHWNGQRWQIAPDHGTTPGQLLVVTVVEHQPWAGGSPFPNDGTSTFVETLCT